MNLYLISQTENTGYDTYNAAVVAAPDEVAARRIHPSKYYQDWLEKGWGRYDSWATDPANVEVKFLGEAEPDIKQGVVLASFNAG